MEFAPPPEPYVDAATVCEYFGGISHVTLWHWINDGLPVYQRTPHGRRRFKLSEVERWYTEYRFKRTDSAAGNGGDSEDVA